MKSSLFLTSIIWLLAFIFFLIALIKGRKIKILPPLFLVFFISFFSLLSPAGKVLLTLGSFRITYDSLLLGLRRSGILVAMVFFSRLIINPRKKLKGKFGNKLTNVFFYLNLLTQERIQFKKGHIIEAMDKRFLDIWEKDFPQEISDPDKAEDESFFNERKESSSTGILFDPTKGPCNS